MILSLWFLHIPTDPDISLFEWIAHLRSWNMLEIVGVSFLCLMSWSDLDDFVEQAGQQLWVCGSYTFKHFEPSIYIYIVYIHNYIQRRYKVRTWTSHNFHWWIVMIIIILRSLHLEICMPYIPSVSRWSQFASCNRSRFSCVSGSVWLHSYTAGKVRCCRVDVGAHGFCWEFGQQEPARKWTRMHTRKLTHGRVWKCGITWYSELLKLNDFNEMSVPAARTQLLKLTNVASSLCLASYIVFF